MKALAVLQQNNIVVPHVIDARKEAMAEDAVWLLLAGVTEIVACQGKKYTPLDPKKDSKEDILKQIMGRSGTLRAPTLLVGKRLLVGYNDALYAQFSG